MNHDLDLENLVFTSGFRTYYLDVKQTSTGSRYLKITQTRKFANGIYDRQKLVVPKGDFEQFLMLLLKARDHFHQNPITQIPTISGKKVHKTWTEGETAQLLAWMREGVAISEIAVRSKRTIVAIKSRLSKLKSSNSKKAGKS